MKMALRIALFAFAIAALSSCVGNKKIAYLQSKSAQKEARYFSDTTLKTTIPEYTFRVGDVIYVKMEKFKVGEEIFSISNFQMGNFINQITHPYIQGYLVDSAGAIDIPLLGRLEVKGKTLNDLRSEVNQRIEKEFAGSVVEIYQMDATVTVIGEVNRAGRFPLYKVSNNLFDVLVMAGDATDYADRAHIKVLRQTNDGKQNVYHIDLTDINSIASEGFYVQNNDVVIVTPLKRNKFSTANIQWLTSSVTALVAVASLVLSITK